MSRRTPEALAVYRERATNVWVLARWAGVFLIIVAFCLAAWSLNAGSVAPAYAKPAALGLMLAGWVAILAATWLRRRQLKSMTGESA